MAEMSTPENDQLVARVYTSALETRAKKRALSAADQVVYEIEMLSQEVNSGASFEQYFRWASRDELALVRSRLQSLGLPAVANIVSRAFAVAFPDGLPDSDEAMDVLTQWTPEQESQLRELADAFTEFNATITNALATFHRTQTGA